MTGYRWFQGVSLGGVEFCLGGVWVVDGLEGAL